MVRIQYDGYNRHFKILDQEMAPLFEDGEVFLLAVSDSDDFPELELVELRPTAVAHA